MKPFQINKLLNSYRTLSDETLDCFIDLDGRWYLRLTKERRQGAVASTKEFLPRLNNPDLLHEIHHDVRELYADLYLKVFDQNNPVPGTIIIDNVPPYEPSARINAA